MEQLASILNTMGVTEKSQISKHSVGVVRDAGVELIKILARERLVSEWRRAEMGPPGFRSSSRTSTTKPTFDC
eukprot:6348646-Pyramimonas_sp.AAC.1